MRAVDHQRDAYNDIKIEWKTSIYNVGTTARPHFTYPTYAIEIPRRI
jgi:hypothetical protein